jgi:hypothetical protein
LVRGFIGIIGIPAGARCGASEVDPLSMVLAEELR